MLGYYMVALAMNYFALFLDGNVFYMINAAFVGIFIVLILAEISDG